jgi:IS1 family transposase
MYIMGMNRLSKEKQVQVISALVEGNSIRATCRITKVAKGTVLRLLADVGKACAEYQKKTIRNLSCRRIQCDEIWSFCYAKEKNLPKDKKGVYGFGDVYTWTAICADSKLVIGWFVGRRDAISANCFIKDIASRLKNRVQLTTDGHKVYLEAVENAFGADVDFAMLIKLYGEGGGEGVVRYSPAPCVGEIKTKIIGNPDPAHVSTSYVERQNLTMRMSMRRFTRLTNAFSKKVENLEYAIALHFMNYNFCRIHQTLRVTPAMAAKVTDRLWDICDILNLLK